MTYVASKLIPWDIYELFNQKVLEKCFEHRFRIQDAGYKIKNKQFLYH